MYVQKLLYIRHSKNSPDIHMYHTCYCTAEYVYFNKLLYYKPIGFVSKNNIGVCKILLSILL